MKLGQFMLLIVKIVRRLFKYPTGWWGRWCLISSGVTYGKNLNIYSAPVVVRHINSSIVIGDCVTILNNSLENPAGVSHKTVFSAPVDGAKIIIGNNVGISGAVIYASSEIIIKDNVNIGTGAKIYDTDFHPIDRYERRINKQETIPFAPVLIEEDAWIGADAFILKGVTVGAGSIVAAGAVVVRDVPPNTIVGGSPAKVLKILTPSDIK